MKNAIFKVPANRVAEVVAELEKKGISGTIQITFGEAPTVAPPAKPVPPQMSLPLPVVRRRRKKHEYANGIRLKGISARQLVLDTLGSATKAFTRDEIARAFALRGFKPESFSGPLSDLKAEGFVEHVGEGVYCLPGTLEKITRP